MFGHQHRHTYRAALFDRKYYAALVRRLQAEVNTEITSESLWLP